ncbi:hypothetical protein [Bradyrhizobium ottawaense]|uniref:hypothetical protein n=1 Tax=Bradyrhizobium ottawaense TaxID=931866 RepID=UPI003F9EF11A
MASTKGGPGGFDGASNKPQTLPNSIVPFIDKLSVTFNIPAEQGPTFHKLLADALPYKNIFQAAKNNSRYKITRNIALHSTAERILFNAGPKHPGFPDCRLEFNPSKLGWQGINDLDAILMELLPGGWEYVWKHGQITRIDIAVDLPGVGVEDFNILPSMSLTHRTYAQNGICQSIYIGKPSGNQFRIYDKAGEQKAKGINLGQQTTRVEKTFRGLAISPSELGQLPNPFAQLVMVAKLPLAPPDECPRLWARFLDSVAKRGLGPALALLPKMQRTRYRKHMANQPKAGWDPQAFWATWSQAVSDLK